MTIISCGSGVSNVTNFNCNTRYGMINAFWLSKAQTTLSYANALLQALWITKINEAESTRVFIFPGADDVTIVNDGIKFKETNVSKRSLVRQGIDDFTFDYYNQKDCVWNIFKTFNGQEMYAFMLTEKGVILGADNGTSLVAVPCEVIVSEPMPPVNKDEPWKISIYIRLSNTEGNYARAVAPNDSTYNTGTLWNPSALEGIIDVTLTEVGSSSTTVIVVDITGACDGREIDAPLVTADFQVYDVSGAAYEVVTVTNSGNRYTITGTFTAGDYIITLKNQPTMTTKGYEYQSSLTVTTS